MTQEDLAKKLNVSRQTISKWENDQSQPDISSLIRLSELFQISVEEVSYWFTSIKTEKVASSPLQPEKKLFYILLNIEIANLIITLILLLIFLI